MWQLSKTTVNSRQMPLVMIQKNPLEAAALSTVRGKSGIYGTHIAP